MPSKKRSSQQQQEQQRSRGGGQFDESKHPRSPIGQFASKGGGGDDRSARNRADFDRRVRVAEAERAKKAAGKGGGGGGGGRGGRAARPNPEQQRIQRRNESLMNKWGRTAGERERGFKRHVDLDLDMKPEELKAIEDELMRVHKVDRARLYDDLGLFEAVTRAVDEHQQEQRATQRRGRAADTARRAAESAQRAAERAALEQRRKAGQQLRDEELARRVREQRIRATGAPNPRTFPVPSTISSAWLGSAATLDQLDLVARLPGEAGDWAARVVDRERDRVIEQALGEERALPRGVVVPLDEIDADVVVALLSRGGVIAGAIPRDVDVEILPLDASEVGFALRALRVDGASGVILNPATPVAFLSRIRDAAITAAGYEELPAGAHVVAVVDELDRNAVLDLIAVLPGPRVLRRHDGAWQEDDKWVKLLRSVRPPPVVEVTASLAPAVISQVDEATRGQPFEETTVAASGELDDDVGGFVAALEADADDAALELLPIVAAQGRVRSGVYDVAGVMPPHLQRYWIAGPGAAKIRWGTPGAWRRCHRLLSKYMGPFKSKGACTNLGQKLGGKGVAWDVGGGAKRAIRRAAS